MSKKSKRAKLSRPMKQFQQRSSVSSQIQERLVDRIQYAQQQTRGGDFAGLHQYLRTLASLPTQAFRDAP